MNSKRNIVIIVIVCITIFFAGFGLYYLTRKRHSPQHLNIDEELKRRADLNVRLLQERNPMNPNL